MPVLNIFVDRALEPQKLDRLVDALPSLRAKVCGELKVDPSTSQLAIVPVYGLPDQPLLSVDLRILPKPERTREFLLSVCAQIRAALTEAAGERAAVRVTTQDPETFIVVR